MSRSSLACCAAALLAGCVDTTTQANTHDFGGTWRYVETLIDVPNDIQCADTGLYHWTQSGVVFEGGYSQRGICRTRGGLVNNADTGAVTAGEIVGRTIRFRAGVFCDYDGVFEQATQRISGRAVCILSNDQQTLTLTGTWSAER